MDLVAHLYRQRAFSRATFGPGHRTAGVCDHIRKELVEIEGNPLELFEWTDVILLALDGAWRAGHSPEDIAKALSVKQSLNETRDWPDWRTAAPDKAIEHVRYPARTEAMRYWLATWMFRRAYELRLLGSWLGAKAMRMAGPDAELRHKDETLWRSK